MAKTISINQNPFKMKIISEYQKKLDAVKAEKEQTMVKIVDLLENINKKIYNVELWMDLWEEKEKHYDLLSNQTMNQIYYEQKIQSLL